MEEELLVMVEGLDVVELVRGPYIHGVQELQAESANP